MRKFFKKLLISKHTTHFWTKARIEKSENDAHRLSHGTNSYKKHYTFIFLVAISPTDCIVFVSDTYCVCTIDQFIWNIDCSDCSDEVTTERCVQMTEDFLFY